MRTVTAFLVVFALLGDSNLSVGQEPFTIDQLRFKSIFASKIDEPDSMYCLLGSGELRSLRTKDSDSMVSSWLKTHPHARVVKVSEMSPMMRNGTGKYIYIWVIDGSENLNVHLVREGIFPAGVMYDAIDFFNALKHEGNAPAEKTQLHRLVNEGVYSEFAKKVNDAQELAEADKKGIWSDEYKQERESEGIQ
ncbi:MAG TPA: hypothetical protein VEO19_05910 [Terriglobia bacterium]|nr:hypothetical protein [Terriglobia bacterium]